MKAKRLIWLLAAALALALFLPAAASGDGVLKPRLTPGGTMIGDMNKDDRVNTLDRMILARYLAKWDGYAERILDMDAADVNLDTKVNTLDRMILARYLAKWEGYESYFIAEALPEPVAGGSCGDSLTWTLYEDGLLEIKGTGKMSDYENSGTAPWIAYKDQLKCLSLSEGVTSIGDYAFADCCGFEGELAIPQTVTSIGEWAFTRCENLTGSLSIPDSVTSIGTGAFSYCGGFTDLTLPAGLTSIGEQAFSGGNYTGTLTIPDGVLTIGDGAFEQCDQFTGDLVIPDGVTSIGENAFSGCAGFSGTLTLPKSLTEIGGGAFAGCAGFEGVLTFPAGVTSVGSGAFDGCAGLTSALFYGDAPAAGDSVFGARDGSFVVSRSETKEGWPEEGASWQGYVTAVFDASSSEPSDGVPTDPLKV